MERVKQAAQEMPRVVFVSDGPISQKFRDLFPGTEFVRPADMKERTRAATDSRRVEATVLAAILDAIKPLAFAELDKIAAEHGLSFSGEEREALFALSKVFDPEVAKAAARTACAAFSKETRQ
jgi:hypothetical protein